MTKLRLNREMRETLSSFARANVVAGSADAIDRSYAKALPLVLAVVRKKYPEEDMLILKKYERSRLDGCLVGYGENGQQLVFNCRLGDEPLVPTGSCSSRNYAWTAKTLAAIEDCNLKADQAKDEREKILRDYRALIENYQTVEDLLEVWPAAISVLQGYLDAANRNLPATLSAEAVDRIRSLNIGAQALAA